MDGNLLINNIRKLCKKNGISISKLEADLFLSSGLISRWSKSMPSLDKIADIADYFGVSIDELAGRSNSQTGNAYSGRFILLLHRQSICGETVWELLDPQSLPDELSDAKLPKNMLDNLCTSYYTVYQNGFFILTASHASDKTLKLALYILPNIYCRCECICSDIDNLTRLYSFLELRFREKSNTMKTHNLIYSYIQENASAEVPENEKITLLRDADSASNY